MTPAAAFDTLLAAYRERGAALARQGGAGVVVGLVGNTVPAELVRACGAQALRIAPVDGDPHAADRHVEAFSDPDARRIFAAFVAGAYDGLRLLVLPRSSESWHKLYLALREAVRTGLKTDGPPLWLHDVPHTQRESSRRYGLARTQDLAARLAALTGQTATPERLRAAIAQGNSTRRLLQRLQAWRAEGRVSGTTAQVLTGAPCFMTPADAQAALQAWLDQPAPPARQRPRLFVQGVPLDHAELHALVDQAGGCAVQEDDDWGSRAAAPLIAETPDPMQALFDHYWRDVPCLRIHPPPPGPSTFVAAFAQGRIDGLVVHLPRPDDLHGWRFPAQRAEAEACGLPWLCLRDDARDASARPALQQALSAFVQRLRRT